MKLDEFIKMCASHDWDELKSFLSSDIKDLATKILVSAIIQEHHPNSSVAHEYGLRECWGKRLSATPVPTMLAMLCSAVDLADLAGAYALAGLKGLEDNKAAEAIAQFVKTNKLQLGQYLKSDQVAQEEKNFITGLFGDLLLNKAEKEGYFKKNFAQYAKRKIAFLQAKDQVNTDIARIFDLAESDFHATFELKSNMRGVEDFPMGSAGHISFKKKISNELIEALVKAFKELGIASNYYNMGFYTGSKNSRGIQVWDQPEEAHQKLSEFAQFLADKTTASVENSSNVANTQRFFKAAEIVREVKTLAVEPVIQKTMKHS